MKYCLLLIGFFICLPSHGQLVPFGRPTLFPNLRQNRIIIPNLFTKADQTKNKKSMDKWKEIIKSRNGDPEQTQWTVYSDWNDTSFPDVDEEITSRSYGRLSNITKWAQESIHLAPNQVFEFNGLVKEALKDDKVTWWEYYLIDIAEDRYREAKKIAEKKEAIRKYKAKILSNIGAE